MKIKLILSLTLFVIGLLSGCGKNQDTTPIAKEPYGSMADFFTKNGTLLQLFSLDAATGGIVTGSQGTKITFPAHAFKHSNGIYVNGQVTVTLREVYKKADMLLSNISTMDYGTPLSSGGMFELLAYQGNEKLYMANGKSYTAELPSAIPDPQMRGYVGIPDSLSGINWMVADTAQGDTVGWGISSFYMNVLMEATGYLTTSNYFGWENCDHPWTNGAYISLSMQANDPVNEYTTSVYLIFKGNTLIQPWYSIANTFNYSYAPVDSAATLVAVGLKDSILYSSFVPVTLGNASQTMTFKLQKTTTGDFKEAIDLLN